MTKQILINIKIILMFLKTDTILYNLKIIVVNYTICLCGKVSRRLYRINTFMKYSKWSSYNRNSVTGV